MNWHHCMVHMSWNVCHSGMFQIWVKILGTTQNYAEITGASWELHWSIKQNHEYEHKILESIFRKILYPYSSIKTSSISSKDNSNVFLWDLCLLLFSCGNFEPFLANINIIYVSVLGPPVANLDIKYQILTQNQGGRGKGAIYH